VVFTYKTGEDIRKGDRVLLHGEAGEVEYLAHPAISDPQTDWYVQEYGGGGMVLEPQYFGRAFLPEAEKSDLYLVTRGE